MPSYKRPRVSESPLALHSPDAFGRASRLSSKNSFDVRDFDYVTRFELFLAALNHDVIHLDLYLAFGSSDEVAVLTPINQSCDDFLFLVDGFGRRRAADFQDIFECLLFELHATL